MKNIIIDSAVLQKKILEKTNKWFLKKDLFTCLRRMTCIHVHFSIGNVALITPEANHWNRVCPQPGRSWPVPEQHLADAAAALRLYNRNKPKTEKKELILFPFFSDKKFFLGSFLLLRLYLLPCYVYESFFSNFPFSLIDKGFIFLFLLLIVKLNSLKGFSALT
jgi:hypothetical protein